MILKISCCSSIQLEGYFYVGSSLKLEPKQFGGLKYFGAINNLSGACRMIAPAYNDMKITNDIEVL